MNHNKVGLVYEPYLTQHRKDDFHFERPERIQAIYRELLNQGLVELCQPIKSKLASDQVITLTHDSEYLRRMIRQLSNDNPRLGDNDMFGNKYTVDCARLAAGSTVHLIEKIIEGEITSGFAIVRPPGHHACSAKYSGFCFLNNVMIGAMSALNANPNLKIWIVDIDVHVGDGTIELIRKHGQNSPYDSNHLRYFSIHRYDNGTFYPGGEVGRSGSYPNNQIVTVGFDGSRGDRYYRQIFRDLAIPIGKEFQPDLIIVSAGFDAARGDPLGNCDLTPQGYHRLIKMLESVSPNIAMVLEGGYNLSAISKSAAACVKALLSLNHDDQFEAPEEIVIR